MDIENTLLRLREAAVEIDRAADDPRTQAVLEKTWILQERLTFPGQVKNGTASWFSSLLTKCSRDWTGARRTASERSGIFDFAVLSTYAGRLGTA